MKLQSEIEQEALFVESQIPNHPKYIKYEMLKKEGRNEQEIEDAFKKVWNEIYI